jgi:hypothetical protein
MTKKFKFFVKESKVTPYSPLNHTGTVNRRLIGPKETGSENLEVLLGVVSKSHGALPHSHPGIDQVCYVIEGRRLPALSEEHKSGERSPGEVDYDLMVLETLAALDRTQVADDAEMAVAHPSQMAVLEVPHAMSMHWPAIPSILDLAESILRGIRA